MFLLFQMLLNIHCESKKLDPFSLEHNFGKYRPILIILSLLQKGTRESAFTSDRQTRTKTCTSFVGGN